MQILRLSLFLFAFSLSINSFCQITPKSQSIQITGDSTTKEKVIQALVSSGYLIKNVNEYSIQTDFKRMKSWGFDINVSTINNTYTFNIFWNSSISMYWGSGVSTGPQRGKCSYKGMKSSAFKVGFNDLNDLVKSLGYPVTYIL